MSLALDRFTPQRESILKPPPSDSSVSASQGGQDLAAQEMSVSQEWSCKLGGPIFSTPAVVPHSGSIIAATAVGDISSISQAGQIPPLIS